MLLLLHDTRISPHVDTWLVDSPWVISHSMSTWQILKEKSILSLVYAFLLFTGIIWEGDIFFIIFICWLCAGHRGGSTQFKITHMLIVGCIHREYKGACTVVFWTWWSKGYCNEIVCQIWGRNCQRYHSWDCGKRLVHESRNIDSIGPLFWLMKLEFSRHIDVDVCKEFQNCPSSLTAFLLD